MYTEWDGNDLKSLKKSEDLAFDCTDKHNFLTVMVSE